MIPCVYIVWMWSVVVVMMLEVFVEVVVVVIMVLKAGECMPCCMSFFACRWLFLW